MTLIEGEPEPTPVPMGTLTPLVHRYVTGRHKRSELVRRTARDLRYTLYGLAEVHGQRPVAQLGPAIIDRWLETIGHLAPSTRRLYLSRVRGFCQWLVAHRHIRRDPTAHVPPIVQPRQQPRTLTQAEIARLYTIAPDTRARAIIGLMVGCGCRCIEVSRLQVSDYDPAGRTILLTGKGRHERLIPVPEETAEALDAYLSDVGAPGGPLIRSRKYPRSPMTAQTISKYMGRWLAQAGVKQAPLDGRSAHALRRTAASDVMDVSGDIRAVQEMLGHARIETTARGYLRPVSMEQLREAMEGRSYVTAA